MIISILIIIILVFLLIKLGLENQKLETEIIHKTNKLEQTIKDLKKAQLKLMESGRTSALASLSAGILHQISQPVTAIHGLVRFMKKETKPEDVFFRSLSVMEEQSTYIKDMLENLMELVRHRKIQKDAVDVNAVLVKSLNLLSDELRIRRIGWDLDLDQQMPHIFADALHLQQVFMNLAVNAMEALSEKGPGQIRVFEVNSHYNPVIHEAVIRFKDNGPGINKEAKEHVFDPFFSTKEKGSGIGLALCHDLIIEHGGQINVHSTKEGSEFIIHLPCLAESR